MWAKKYSNCQNCKSTRRKHSALGYCTKCYPLNKKLEQAKLWDFNNINSLNSFPKGFSRIDQRTFDKIKNGVIKQLGERLDWLRIRERQLNSNIQGITIEHGYRRIAEFCGARDKDLFYGIAGLFDHNFSQKQKKIIFELINDLEQ